jgi:RNA polymerase sigma-70 factor, ECF subfamily
VNLDDRRLITETMRGKTASFGLLVRRYQDRLFNAVLRVTDNADDAADVVQETFINAYQSLNSFKGESEFFTWLYRIAFNAAISQRRKKKATLSFDLSPNGDRGGHGDRIHEPADESEDSRPEAALERSEDELRLQAALNKLSPEHRVVLVLKDIDGQRYEDIADVLDVPIGTVRSRLHRARLELRDLLEDD